MGRWRSEYRRTHRGVPRDQLLATFQANLAERRQLRSTMMSSHFQLGSNASSCSNSSDSISDDGLSPTRLRLRHLALTSPERAPPADGRSVRFDAPPEHERPAGTADQLRQTTPPSEPLPGGDTAPRPSAVPREPSIAPRKPSTAPREPSAAPHAGRGRVSTAGGRRSRSPGSPFAGFGQGERGCDVGERRTFNVTVPAPEVHGTALAAAERRQTAQRQRDAALDGVLSHGRPAPRPASRWTTEYQRCFCQPVWAEARQRQRPRSRPD